MSNRRVKSWYESGHPGQEVTADSPQEAAEKLVAALSIAPGLAFQVNAIMASGDREWFDFEARPDGGAVTKFVADEQRKAADLAKAHDEACAAAQKVWSGLGGFGPVPEGFVAAGLGDEEPTQVAFARQRIGEDRHDHRMALIRSALTGAAADLTLAGGVKSRSDAAGAKVECAVALADAVLARLDAEARGGK